MGRASYRRPLNFAKGLQEIGKGKCLLLLQIIVFEVMQQSWRSERDVRVGSGGGPIDF